MPPRLIQLQRAPAPFCTCIMQQPSFDAGHDPHKRLTCAAAVAHGHIQPSQQYFPQALASDSPAHCAKLPWRPSSHSTIVPAPPAGIIELGYHYNSTEVSQVTAGSSYMQLPAPHFYLPEPPLQVNPALSSHPIKVENMPDCRMAPPQVADADECAAHMQCLQELLVTHDQQAAVLAAGNLFHGDKLLPVLQSTQKHHILLPPLQPSIDPIAQLPLATGTSSETALRMLYTSNPSTEIQYGTHLNYSKTAQLIPGKMYVGASTSLFNGSAASVNVQQEPLDALSTVSTRCIAPLENRRCSAISAADGEFSEVKNQIPSGHVLQPTMVAANTGKYRGFGNIADASSVLGMASREDTIISVPRDANSADVWEYERSTHHQITETMPDQKTASVMRRLDGKNTASMAPMPVPGIYHQLQGNTVSNTTASVQPALCRSMSMVAGCPRMLRSARSLDASGARDRAKMKEAMHSKAAANRRRRIQERLRVLRALVPGGAKIGTHLASMLEQAAKYVSFLQAQHTFLLNEIHIENQSSQASTSTCDEARASSLMCGIGHQASNISDCPINPSWAKWNHSRFSQASPLHNSPDSSCSMQTSAPAPTPLPADQRYSPQLAFTECVRSATRFSSCMQDPLPLALPLHLHDGAAEVKYCTLCQNAQSAQADMIEDNMLHVNVDTRSHNMGVGRLDGWLHPSARPFVDNANSEQLLSFTGNHQQVKTHLPHTVLTPTGEAFNHGRLLPGRCKSMRSAPGGVASIDLPAVRSMYGKKVLFHHLLLSAQVQEQLCRTGSCLATLEQANHLNFDPRPNSECQSTAAAAPMLQVPAPSPPEVDPFVQHD